MGNVKKYSATRLVADALKIRKELVPESLRNKIDTYKNNKTIPPEMFEEHQGAHNKSITYKQGNLTFIRNLIILDTLFDNTKKVNQLMLGSLSQKEKEVKVNELLSVLETKRNILNALSPNLDSFRSFLLKDNVNLHKTELPNPFAGKQSISQLLFAQMNNKVENELSSYDTILKSFYAGSYQKTEKLLNNLPETTLMQPEYRLLADIVGREIASAKSYHSFLKNL
ncbi:hypothetical protein GZ77_05170 [Endozoicomonas montiporae]|uniref:Uncharacterized protein n=2 Tax=Endozoicomonas montiporae TaxID=1027273 RepID=A0A081NBS9_9GAMM|nr:hypothetical protein [Endozoicomonas montiporae]AMO56206.1 hypothetical protein EZMO1_2087 [Endozoicomonas montiporae CL-33]KEQ15902.1 hypothetical protein GZ77_05170 [Endozoicomonas montiporae]